MLKITSAMSEIADPFCRELAGYLTERLGTDVVFVDDIPWQERLERLYAGEIHAGWVCGLVYVNFASPLKEKTNVPVIARGAFGPEAISHEHAGGLLRRYAPRNDAQLELLAAPVMRGERYRGCPVYFSDVVVRQDSPACSFEDLRGKVWVYNEPGSYSGYFVMLNRLGKVGEGLSYFGNTVESGAHIASLKMVLEGKADVTAIDSTAFDLYVQHNPDALCHFRVLESLGPNPVPPWVVSRRVSDEVRTELRGAILAMNGNPSGRSILERGSLSRFVEGSDCDYGPVCSVMNSLEICHTFIL